MKYRFILSLVLVVIFSCEKGSIFDEYGLYGQGTAIINDIPWKGKTGVFKAKQYCQPDTCIAILIFNYDEFGVWKSKTLLDFIPLRTGRNLLNPIKPSYLDTLFKISYSEYTSDGDVTTGLYNLIKSDPDYFVEISELNKQTGNVSGKFAARMVRDSFWVPNGSLPDTIDLKDGSFYGRINWR